MAIKYGDVNSWNNARYGARIKWLEENGRAWIDDEKIKATGPSPSHDTDFNYAVWRFWFNNVKYHHATTTYTPSFLATAANEGYIHWSGLPDGEGYYTVGPKVRDITGPENDQHWEPRPLPERTRTSGGSQGAGTRVFKAQSGSGGRSKGGASSTASSQAGINYDELASVLASKLKPDQAASKPRKQRKAANKEGTSSSEDDGPDPNPIQTRREFNKQRQKKRAGKGGKEQRVLNAAKFSNKYSNLSKVRILVGTEEKPIEEVLPEPPPHLIAIAVVDELPMYIYAPCGYAVSPDGIFHSSAGVPVIDDDYKTNDHVLYYNADHDIAKRVMALLVGRAIGDYKFLGKYETDAGIQLIELDEGLFEISSEDLMPITLNQKASLFKKETGTRTGLVKIASIKSATHTADGVWKVPGGWNGADITSEQKANLIRSNALKPEEN